MLFFVTRLRVSFCIKFKKIYIYIYLFTSFKYKTKSGVKTVNVKNEGIRTTEEQPRPTKPSYEQSLKANTDISGKEKKSNPKQ